MSLYPRPPPHAVLQGPLPSCPRPLPWTAILHPKPQTLHPPQVAQEVTCVRKLQAMPATPRQPAAPINMLSLPQSKSGRHKHSGCHQDALRADNKRLSAPAISVACVCHFEMGMVSGKAASSEKEQQDEDRNDDDDEPVFISLEEMMGSDGDSDSENLPSRRYTSWHSYSASQHDDRVHNVPESTGEMYRVHELDVGAPEKRQRTERKGAQRGLGGGEQAEELRRKAPCRTPGRAPPQSAQTRMRPNGKALKSQRKSCVQCKKTSCICAKRLALQFPPKGLRTQTPTTVEDEVEPVAPRHRDAANVGSSKLLHSIERKERRQRAERGDRERANDIETNPDRDIEGARAKSYIYFQGRSLRKREADLAKRHERREREQRPQAARKCERKRVRVQEREQEIAPGVAAEAQARGQRVPASTPCSLLEDETAESYAREEVYGEEHAPVLNLHAMAAADCGPKGRQDRPGGRGLRAAVEVPGCGGDGAAPLEQSYTTGVGSQQAAGSTLKVTEQMRGFNGARPRHFSSKKAVWARVACDSAATEDGAMVPGSSQMWYHAEVVMPASKGAAPAPPLNPRPPAAHLLPGSAFWDSPRLQGDATCQPGEAHRGDSKLLPLPPRLAVVSGGCLPAFHGVTDSSGCSFSSRFKGHFRSFMLPGVGGYVSAGAMVGRGGASGGNGKGGSSLYQEDLAIGGKALSKGLQEQRQRLQQMPRRVPPIQWPQLTAAQATQAAAAAQAASTAGERATQAMRGQDCGKQCEGR